jgi:ribosomal protein L3 glutamine methyltransferase
LSQPATLGALIRAAGRTLRDAGVHLGHGTEHPLDEAAWLAAHAFGLPLPIPPERLAQPADPQRAERYAALLERRVHERIPAAYLTGEAYFAGLRFYVDGRVLIPRSPIAELIEQRFVPWLSRPPSRILDIGTGSACIAIACAYAFPDAQVDAVDVDAGALEVAARNVREHGLDDRVRVIASDLYGALGGRRYDLIVSNPPYVDETEFTALPAEYRHEPALALRSGPDGLDHPLRILAGARRHLMPHGVLVLEVGDNAERLAARCPELPIVWVELERGGAGVGVVRAQELPA